MRGVLHVNSNERLLKAGCPASNLIRIRKGAQKRQTMLKMLLSGARNVEPSDQISMA